MDGQRETGRERAGGSEQDSKREKRNIERDREKGASGDRDRIRAIL
jgi:hypothetical protein